MKRRVVVTGLGAITPIGNNVGEYWNGIKESKNGIDEITLFNHENLKVKMAGTHIRTLLSGKRRAPGFWNG